MRGKVLRQVPFDGIVCMGGLDWWYHNRGHFDFQILRRLARQMPVLYVNSIGVRMPSPGGDPRFIERVGRKLASLKRGLVHVENGFHVFSPVSVPGGAGRLATGWALAPQIRLAARRAGLRRPLLWVHCPVDGGLIGALRPAAVLLQRTDRFEAFPDGDPVVLGRMIADLKARADLVLYCNGELMRAEEGEVRRAALVTHGVDLARFVAAGLAGGPGPAGMVALPRPRAAFIGAIDAHTFDPDLFNQVAGLLPDVTFAMIGGSTLAPGWCPHRNVHFLGRKPYDEIATYMAAADVLLMPWNKSEWIRACNPVKLKEYLAVGRPVVTRDFPALAPFRDLVSVADGAPSFAAAIRQALAEPTDAAIARRRIASEDWDEKAGEVRAAIGELGLVLPRREPRVSAAA